MELTIEDLKCCGNCWHRERFKAINYAVLEFCKLKRNEPIESGMICPEWEYDGVQNRRWKVLNK